jgi:hypothetical protein
MNEGIHSCLIAIGDVYNKFLACQAIIAVENIRSKRLRFWEIIWIWIVVFSELDRRTFLSLTFLGIYDLIQDRPFGKLVCDTFDFFIHALLS